MPPLYIASLASDGDDDNVLGKMDDNELGYCFAGHDGSEQQPMKSEVYMELKKTVAVMLKTLRPPVINISKRNVPNMFTLITIVSRISHRLQYDYVLTVSRFSATYLPAHANHVFLPLPDIRSHPRNRAKPITLNFY